ncbi:hypothetical protein Trco_001133 [Trichoderma cornu-damae]|uniref:N-acetyltransferase domain-containing protein n=1 Tax=Trichoderma cornu-damae TaxID=654480 RepID=A0A9P8QYI5_9HYPO|nr:hypothetical protein Trco_001133 [Trichoderma cornu-damae]
MGDRVSAVALMEIPSKWMADTTPAVNALRKRLRPWLLIKMTNSHFCCCPFLLFVFSTTALHTASSSSLSTFIRSVDFCVKQLPRPLLLFASKLPHSHALMPPCFAVCAYLLANLDAVSAAGVAIKLPPGVITSREQGFTGLYFGGSPLSRYAIGNNMATRAFWPVEKTTSLYPSEIPERPVASILWDYQACVPLVQLPTRDKPIILLTPVVMPPVGNDPRDDRDPFEILGQTISSRDIAVRHVPYTKNQGITGVHVAFIRRAGAVIFVITHLADTGNPLQLEFAELVARICESRPLIILVCCAIAGRNISNTRFRTLVHVAGYANADLLVAATLLLDGASKLAAPPVNAGMPAWSVRPWVAERDLLETCALWQACLPYQFHLSAAALGSLLKRDGYALHYIVRESTRGSLVGFCAAYATFADTSDVALIGSIGAIIVQAAYRGQGIGSSLHDAALNKLQRVRGVQKLQLGTTFPRLLCGLTAEMVYASQWFARKGWPVNTQGRGDQGGLVTDWILRFTDLPGVAIPVAGLGFRRCNESDVQQVLDIDHRRPATSHHGFGWYDQYARTLNSEYMGDIVVGFDNATIVATAITYIPGQKSPAATDIPWPGLLNSNIGGVTCICIREVAGSRDNIMASLLYACSQTLSQRGMTGMFLDGVSFGEQGLTALGECAKYRTNVQYHTRLFSRVVPGNIDGAIIGFRKWAEYRETWREM